MVWILLGLSFVFLMNLGFIMIEIGTVSNKSVDMIIKKTILSFVVCSLTFYCFGYSLSNYAYGGFIGTGMYFCAEINTSQML